MKSKIVEYKKLLDRFNNLLKNQPFFPSDNSEEGQWNKDLNKFNSDIQLTLETKMLSRFNQIDFGVYDDVDSNFNYVFSGLKNSTIKKVLTILEDEIFFFEKKPQKTEIDMQKRKLLEARRETMDFEEKLAEIICGDNTKFPYRTSWYITKFFQENGFDYKHDGTTRSRWISSILFEFNIDKIYFITQAIFKRKYFIKHCQEKAIDLDQCIQEAQIEFSNFLENSIKSNEIIDLSLAYRLNVNFELLSNKIAKTKDTYFNTMIENSRNFYIEGNKQSAIEKLWDAFERLKTIIQPGNKKESTDKLVKLLSNQINYDEFDNEFKNLTKIGNDYMIRHSEVDKIPITDDRIKDYLFFRMLALIDLCISKLSVTK